MHSKNGMMTDDIHMQLSNIDKQNMLCYDDDDDWYFTAIFVHIVG